jgi:AcrR family transcriptional regulator
VKNTRDRVLEVAAKVIAESGYETLQIGNLTLATGVSNGSIYHHFGSREGILLALLRRAVVTPQQVVLNAMRTHPDDPSGAVRITIAELLTWSERHPRDARLLLDHRDRARGRADRAFAATVEQWLAREAEAGRIPAIGLQTAQALTLAPAQELVRQWLRGIDRRPPTSHAARLGDAAWAALLAAGPDPNPKVVR